jgi:hypothetical protein
LHSACTGGSSSQESSRHAILPTSATKSWRDKLMKPKGYSTSLLNRCIRPPTSTSSLKPSRAAHSLPSLRFHLNPSIFLPSNSTGCRLPPRLSQVKPKRLSSHSHSSFSKHLRPWPLGTQAPISHPSTR